MANIAYFTWIDSPSVTDCVRFALRTDVWPRDKLRWVHGAAIGGLTLDAVTTWYIMTTEGYREFNLVLEGLWQIHPLFVAAYFVGFMLCVSAVSLYRQGWLSTALAGYVIVVMGIFGGLNNLELIAVGSPALIDVVADWLTVSGWTFIHTVVPSVGVIVAIAVARLRHGSLPLGGVVGVFAAVGVIIVASPVVASVLATV